jgi:AraC-like DNA-binding protein
MSCPTRCEEEVCAGAVRRGGEQSQGLRTEFSLVNERESFEYHFKGPHHRSAAIEQNDQDRSVGRLPAPALHSLSGTLTFVVTSREFYGWQQPAEPIDGNTFELGLQGPVQDDEQREQQSYFSERVLWRRPVAPNNVNANGDLLVYDGEALGSMPGHVPARISEALSPATVRGGLSGWQRKKVADFIEEHLAEEVRLSVLAALVDLSPYHFARAFKQSFGVPPHRYHIGRRVERAKTLLADEARSVTEVALALGFAETSSFSASFRKVTGFSPTAYRRGRG